MPPQFKPPKDDAEFEKRADEMTLNGTKSLLVARRRQREAAVKPFDDEILFLKKVLRHKGETL